MVPFPNWPEPLSPQHLAVPFANNAHEWNSPAAIATAVVRPLTTTGVDELVGGAVPQLP